MSYQGERILSVTPQSGASMGTCAGCIALVPKIPMKMLRSTRRAIMLAKMKLMMYTTVEY
ncbi:hypothetical protein RBH76_05900 [Oscillospiraceae bacterium MB24-C1]|nr:hypothetical protein RBH76_05900 [Oscillospiraceae bacterium MB24-C1]